MCGLFWGAHKSLAPRARTLLGGLGQATLSFFAVATLLFVFFGECPIFCDLAKQRRKIVGGVSEVGKDDFSLYFCWRCVFFSLFYFLSAAIARHDAWRSLRAKGMGVSVGLPVDRVWNGGSDLQAGVEIYYWEHPRILAHFEKSL